MGAHFSSGFTRWDPLAARSSFERGAGMAGLRAYEDSAFFVPLAPAKEGVVSAAVQLPEQAKPIDNCQCQPAVCPSASNLSGLGQAEIFGMSPIMLAALAGGGWLLWNFVGKPSKRKALSRARARHKARVAGIKARYA